MYPIIRFAKEMWKFRAAPPLGPGAVHVSSHVCWPLDVDPWMELNNGRTLTLYDLGRMPLTKRTGMIRAMKDNGWGMAVAGASIRYRRRVRMFHRITMRSAYLGWDDRFFYVEQTMWRSGDAVSNAVFRLAMTDAAGIAPPARMTEVLGWGTQSPLLPAHVTAWIKAESRRPWPPAM
jgi:acyl-CoA thioesterase FadM